MTISPRWFLILIVSGFALLPGVLTLGLVIGFEQGEGKTNPSCGAAIRSSAAGLHAELLTRHTEAIDAIRRGDLGQAEALLRLLAKDDAGFVVQCKANADCNRVIGMRPLTEAALQRVVGSR